MRIGKLGTWWLGGTFLVLLSLILVSAPAVAQHGEGAAAEGDGAEVTVDEHKSGFVDFFEKGGDFMYPLLALAVIGLAVIFERLITLQRARTNTRKLMAAIVQGLKTKGVDEAMNICMHTRGPIAAILHAGLAKVEKGPNHVEKAIENSGAIEMAFLQRGLPVLATVANIAPLLGFLGTVAGMIHAFEAIAAAEQVSAKVVASGISEALITTMTGLVIAIPVQATYNYFTAQIDRFVLEMEETSVELLDALTDEG
jgi:biopolymer transport protein ExbB